MTTTLTTAGSALTVSSDRLPRGIAQALPLALLWCEAAARGKGLKLGSDAYFDSVAAEMGRIAWIVTEADRSSYAASGGQTNPGQAVLAIANGLVPASQFADLSLLFARIAGAQPGGALASTLTTWWDARKSSATGTAFAAVPAGINDNLQLEATLVQLDFDVFAESWRSFFVGRLQSGARAVARHVRLTLNADLWERFESGISQRLGQSAIASVQSIEL